MKEIKQVKEIYETAYQAADGQIFNNREECYKYENTALGVVRGNIAKLIVGRSNDAWELMGGDDDNINSRLNIINNLNDLDKKADNAV